MPNPLHASLQQLARRHEAELIGLHRALVRIPSVNHGDGSSAGEDRVAALLTEYFAGHGLAARTLESAPGRANCIAEWGQGEVLQLWMSHSDVVPAEDPGAWTHPPFSATLDAGRIWGRGANDCKMLVAAQAFMLACLARLGAALPGRIRMIAGADEESGGRFGFGWLSREHPDLLRAPLALCEGGGSTLGRTPEGMPLVSAGCGEKGRYDLIVHFRSEGGHAAAPWGRVNPLVEAGRLLARIEAWRPAAAPASPVFLHIGALNGQNRPLAAGELEPFIDAVDRQSPGLARLLRAQSRMTFTPTVLHGGDSSNVIPTEARLVCDSRLLPGQSIAEIETLVHRFTEGLSGTQVELRENAPASACDLPEPLRLRFQRAVERATGTPVQIVPTWCTGSTDAHWVRALGTPVYGFQFIHPAADAARLGIHCIDESIEAQMLLPCALTLGHFALDTPAITGPAAPPE